MTLEYNGIVMVVEKLDGIIKHGLLWDEDNVKVTGVLYPKADTQSGDEPPKD